MSNDRLNAEVLIVGAGPAGLAAASTAAQSGGKVTVIDDNPAPGGQIWRGEQQKSSSLEAAFWLKQAQESGAEFRRGARVFAQPRPGVLLAETQDGVCELRYQKLILALGARERFLPFPGWTLPNVLGAGGLQALVKSGLPIKDQRVVVSGSGPLLMAVAVYLRKQGADVVLIAEQAPLNRLVGFSLALFRQVGKARQALSLKSELLGVDYLTGCWVESARGDHQLKSVTLRKRDRRWDVACDYLACGFHLMPSTELAALLGCEIQSAAVRVDKYQRTSVEGIYCAGESTGIGGLDLSLLEGQIAGFAAAGKQAAAEKLFASRARAQRFADRMNRAFALRDELKQLAQAETIVCRCEDVTFGRLKEQRLWREAKLQTRCGMGPCQGRICGGAAEFLFGWQVESIRPPAFPCRVESLSQTASGD